MINRLPTNCRQILFHLWARLQTDATINEVIPLYRAELFESVVFLHSHSILTMLMNDSQTADELGNAYRLLYFAIKKTLMTSEEPITREFDPTLPLSSLSPCTCFAKKHNHSKNKSLRLQK